MSYELPYGPYAQSPIPNAQFPIPTSLYRYKTQLLLNSGLK